MFIYQMDWWSEKWKLEQPRSFPLAFSKTIGHYTRYYLVETDRPFPNSLVTTPRKLTAYWSATRSISHNAAEFTGLSLLLQKNFKCKNVIIYYLGYLINWVMNILLCTYCETKDQ